MKRMNYLYTVLLLCLGIGARAGNVVTISSAEGVPDDEVTISIGLQNTDAVSSLQLSIPLDDNLTLVEESGELGSRCASHSLTVGVKEGTLNVLIYSLSMTAISGNDGKVASFKMKLGNQPKTIALTPSKTILTTPAGQTVNSSAQSGQVTIRCAKAQYSTMEVDFGKVPIRSTYQRTVTVTNVGNSDLTINGLVFSDVNVFSSTTSLPLTIGAGSSESLNVIYAPLERGSILKTMKVECNSISKLNTIKLLAQPFAVNELHIQPASGISDEEITVSMTMNNMDAISGYQVEFDLPEQLEYVDGSFTLSDRKQDHVSTASINGQKLRVIVYSPIDKPLIGDDGEIGSFKVKLVGRYSTMLTPTKTVLSATINNKVENVVSAVYGGQITIKSPQISCNNQLDFGAVPVTEDCEKAFTICNYGNAPLTVSRIVFNNENLSIKESLPLVVPTYGNANVTVVYSSVEQKAFESSMNIYSNDPDQRMKVVTVRGRRFAPNYVEMKAADTYVDRNVDVEVDLNVFDAVSGLQFDLIYPSQHYETFDGHVTLESRAEGMTVTYRKIDSQTIRYFCYLLSGQSIPEGNGKLMTIQLRPKNETVPEGTYQVGMKNIMIGVSGLTDKYSGTDLQNSFMVKQHNPVTVTAKSYSRLYGDNNPTFEYTVEGGTLIGQPAITCEATATSPVGEYPIVISKGSVENDEDTYVNGKLTVTKAPLTITAKSYTITQGDALPTFDAEYSGFKNDETAVVLTKKPVLTTSVTSSSEPGTFDIIASGAEAENYEISYVKGTLTINPGVYKLTYMVDGKVYKTYDVVYGTAITPEAEPTKEGYTFSGWSEIPATMPAHDVTVIGTFNINKYKLTYLVDGEVFKSYDIEFGVTITPEAAPTKEGYTFSGWSEIPETMPAHDVTVTGSFSKGQFKLIYVVDGKTYKTISYDYGDAITPEPAPTKEGCTFSGWSEIPATMPAHDVTVTGSFTVNKYKVNYFVDANPYYTDMVEYGATIVPPTVAEREGYTFAWGYIPDTMPAYDISIYGQYTVKTGIDQLVSDSADGAMIFTIDGKRIDKLQKGLNIIRTSDGKISKKIVK